MLREMIENVVNYISLFLRFIQFITKSLFVLRLFCGFCHLMYNTFSSEMGIYTWSGKKRCSLGLLLRIPEEMLTGLSMVGVFPALTTKEFFTHL